MSPAEAKRPVVYVDTRRERASGLRSGAFDTLEYARERGSCRVVPLWIEKKQRVAIAHGGLSPKSKKAPVWRPAAVRRMPWNNADSGEEMPARMVSLMMAVVLGLASPAQELLGQSASERASFAALIQRSLVSEGCTRCRVRVSGLNNTVIEVVDPQVRTTPNDYHMRPTAYYNAGFRTVIYYDGEQRVYAQHRLDSVSPVRSSQAPASTRAVLARPRAAARSGASPLSPTKPSDASVSTESKRTPGLNNDQAFALLSAALKAIKPYPHTPDLKCVAIYTGETTSEYVEFNVHERHVAPCRGDPETGPLLDSFRVSRLTAAIDWSESGDWRDLSTCIESRRRP